jgi:hyperosmotically inducible periplasmic protein
MSRKHSFTWLYAATVAGLMACGGATFAHDTGPDETGKLNTVDDQRQDDDRKSDGIGAAISDTAITAKVKSKFGTDTRLENTEIDVSTANGVVLLKGSAPSKKAKRAAGDLALYVEGVQRVDNQLVTPASAEVASAEAKTKNAIDESERVASDSWITTKVKAALLADERTKGSQISVKTTHKVVHLTGTVDSQAEKDSAKDVARGIKHVKKVDASGLKVEG